MSPTKPRSSPALTARLARWGRVDSIACCAGIAPPFNLVDFPLDKWRLAMEINLTGYFMGREAARIMQAQGHGGSMVLLSHPNPVWNPPRPIAPTTPPRLVNCTWPAVGLSWAATASASTASHPNVFEGSKIWNPEYIAKAAAKKGIKPEEVIPYCKISRP